MKKLKKQSTGYYKGGWGTFIIAFEDDSSPIQKNIYDGSLDPTPMNKGSNKTPTANSKREESRASSTGDYGFADQSGDNTKPHKIEKICHFVEVGFLLDRNNFRLLNTFAETTYDSNLKKYLFEMQDPISNHQMNDLEFKIK